MSCKAMMLAAVALGAAALGGCESVDPRTGSPDPHFGAAIALNKAVQTVNPDPVVAADAAQAGASGARAAGAAGRYRRGEVRQIERIGTTSGSSGGSLGGGSGPGAN